MTPLLWQILAIAGATGLLAAIGLLCWWLTALLEPDEHDEPNEFEDAMSRWRAMRDAMEDAD